MDAVLQALGEANRRSILQLVATDELSAGQIASNFSITRPAVSQHLTVLKEAGLLTERREGTKRLYRARPEGLEELRVYLEGFWQGHLARLKQVVERKQRRKH